MELPHYDSNTIRLRDRSREFEGERVGIYISRTEKGTGQSWWVGVPRGPQWDEKVAWAERVMNPAQIVSSVPKGGVYK